MVAEVRIATARDDVTVIVPEVAVVYREGKPVIFVVRNDRAEWRDVRPGASNGEEIGILDGISVGEEVITEGHFVLAHGARVAVRTNQKEE
jgi:multidrug efflux pump subunit AcrA (membrane-fusion protein)